jgi:hypothetical protein
MPGSGPDVCLRQAGCTPWRLTEQELIDTIDRN